MQQLTGEQAMDVLKVGVRPQGIPEKEVLHDRLFVHLHLIEQRQVRPWAVSAQECLAVSRVRVVAWTRAFCRPRTGEPFC